MKTSLIIGILVLLAMPVAAEAINDFCVSRTTVGRVPPPPNGVNAYQPRNTIGWQGFFNFVAPPIPGRPWGAGNLGNTGNVWFNPTPPLVPMNLQANDQIDAIDTLGDIEDGTRFFFSVDAGSVGAQNSDVARVRAMSPGRQAGSIFYTNRTGINLWSLDALEIGLGWPQLPQDELCAYDVNTTPNLQIAFSLDAASPSLVQPTVTYSPADIFIFDYNNGAGGVVMPATAPAGKPHLGLKSDDDIDALVYFHITPVPDFHIAFSLAPGSPTLTAKGWSPADVILSDGMGNLQRLATANQIGLQATDNVDALDGFTEYSSLFVGTPPASYEQFGWGWDMTFLQMTGDIAVPEPRACYSILLSIFVATVFALRLKSK